MVAYLFLDDQNSLLLIGNQLASLWSGIALLWGTYRFLEHNIPKKWIYFCILLSAYIIFVGLKSQSVFWLSLPIFLFLGGVYIWTGVIFIRQKQFPGNLSTAVGFLFVVWGIHKADYPFLRPLAWFAPWGYLVGAVLELSIALGMLMIYFQQTQQQLCLSEKKFRNIFENAVEGFFQSTPEGRFVNVNPAFAMLLGYDSPKDLISSIMDIETQYYVEPVFIVRDLSEMMQAKTALIESETRFKTFYDNAPISYQSFDENGCFVEVNKTWLDLLGFERSEVIGRHFSEFINPDWRDHFKSNFPKFKSIGEILGVEFEMVKKDGTSILVSFHGKISKKDDGSFKQTHCIFWDVSEQRRTKKEKEEIKRKLSQMQKLESIGNLAAGIAHDFNNLLFPIVGMSEMLMEDLPPGSLQHQNVKEIFKAGKRGSELVKQILAFIRQTEHKKILLRIQKVLREALKLCRSTIPSDIEIVQDIQMDCGPVLADPTQLHQIVMNLVTNAYHAVEPTGGSIAVGLKKTFLEMENLTDETMDPGPYALLTVADTGCGIDPTVIYRIFEPYFTTKKQGRGTRLGLAMVYGIVKEYVGSISVYSEVGEGTTFTVLLPLIKNDPHKIESEKEESIEGGSESILLVDDEAPIVRVEKQILERLGYRVASFTSSIQALDAFTTNPYAYDLVMTDMTMPQMTGDRLAEQIIAIRSDIPVIICTGFSERMGRERAAHFGIKGFLMKPVAKSDIARLVRNLLDKKMDMVDNRATTLY